MGVGVEGVEGARTQVCYQPRVTQPLKWALEAHRTMLHLHTKIVSDLQNITLDGAENDTLKLGFKDIFQAN